MSSVSIEIQERDVALLRCLFESRVMATSHVADLLFDGRKEAAKKRLQKLKSAGYLSERARRAFEPSLLFLSKRGLTVLRAQGVIAEYPAFSMPALERRARVSQATIAHELEVMDVKSAFHRALTVSQHLSLAEFSTWPLLNQFEASRRCDNRIETVLVKPDGFVRIHEREPAGVLSEHTFFLELDRSTETQDTLVARLGCYLDYYRTGGFAVRNGASPDAFKEFPFRVLVVFKTAERLNNTAERLLSARPPILTMACMSTYADAIAEPFGFIWSNPADYRAATSGSEFDPARGRQQMGYVRRSAREHFVQQRVKRWKLIPDQDSA